MMRLSPSRDEKAVLGFMSCAMLKIQMANPVLVTGSPLRARRRWESQSADLSTGKEVHMWEFGERCVVGDDVLVSS